jgi:hypothetical protein
MKTLTKHLLDTRLKGGALEQAIKQFGLSTRFAGVARSAGFGTATVQAAEDKAERRAAGRRAKASRRRNR